jgi:alpha-galactosidase/6-phospho-beta-glucosidase family protein
VKVAFIGAGSTVFAQTLIGDLLAHGELVPHLG